jgi:hypothetical protein
LVVVGGLMAGRRLDGWTGLFLSTTVLTNVTGFGFPFPPIIASHYVAILSPLTLPAVLYALYRRRLAGRWRRVFVIGTVLTLYLNVFVLVVQLFRRLPALLASAPTQQEAPFLITQLVTLALFIWLGRAALRGFSAEAGPRVAAA